MFTESNRYGVSSKASSRDEGLRQYMIAVYRYMSLALLFTAVVAFMTANSQSLMTMLFTTPLRYVVMFAPLIAVIWLNGKMGSMSLGEAQMGFWVFAGLMGISLSYIFVAYTGISIARTFLVSASVFGVMSIYGQVTKRDLTSMGAFMVMGLWGIIIAGIVNIFMQSAMVEFVTSVLGVIIFTGLTAYDTQRIKDNYYYNSSSYGDGAARIAILGALSLYLDFINLFVSLLRLFGNRR